MGHEAAQQDYGVAKRGWRPGSKSISSLTVICFFIKVILIIRKHLIVYKGVQLSLPATQEMQESSKLEPLRPPQTTSQAPPRLPPDMTERLGPSLG